LRRRILIVDADRNQRRSLAIGLRLLGYLAVEAASAEEALGLAAQDRFDLLVVDVRPRSEMDGLDLARRLREACPRSSLVVTASFDTPGSSRDRLGFEPQGYLCKPFRTEELVPFLRSVSRSSPE
jgi:DNA-binding response OmpR family regulator